MDDPNDIHCDDKTIPRVCYIITIILGILILAFTVTDLITSDLVEQMTGHTHTFPRNLYIVMISAFYTTGFVYAAANWFFNYEDGLRQGVAYKNESIFRQNMTWNLTTFFITSFMFFLYTVISVLDFIFIFATVFSLQVCCCCCLVILSLSKESPENKAVDFT